MADWWIKVSEGLVDSSEVVQMATALGVTPQHVAGCLIEVWLYFGIESDEGELRMHSSDDDARAWFDERFRQVSLGNAMENVRPDPWIRFRSDGTIVCRGKGVRYRKSIRAADRARKARSKEDSDPVPAETERKSSGRSRSRSKSGSSSSGSGKKVAPMPSLPDALRTTEFHAAWKDYREWRAADGCAYRAKQELAQLEELARWGAQEAEEAVRMAYRSGWKAIVRPRAGGGAQRQAGRSGMDTLDRLAALDAQGGE